MQNNLAGKLRSALAMGRFVLPVGLVLGATGCAERDRLAAEISVVKREATELQPLYAEAHAELLRVEKSCQALKNDPLVRKAVGESFEAQLAALTRRKEELETEISALRKEFEAYRNANP